MGKQKIRYLVAKQLKSGRKIWYWQPSKDLRGHGFLPRRLAERTNSLEDAVREAEKLNREVDAWRAGVTTDVIQPYTIPWLIQKYRNHSDYKRLREKTKREYDLALSRIAEFSARADHPHIENFDREVIESWYMHMHEQTPAMAAAVMRVMRILFKHAKSYKYIDDNPLAYIKIRNLPPRKVLWTDEDIEAFCKTAERMGRPSIALAVRLAFHLGQRQADILKIQWKDYHSGSFLIRQNKTGKLLEIPVDKELKKKLERISGATDADAIVISEKTGKKYTQDEFGKIFRKIRNNANLKNIQFLDLRRTAIVRLGEAGCEMYEITSISGHDIDFTKRILETYLPRNRKMAENAIKKRTAYHREKKSTTGKK